MGRERSVVQRAADNDLTHLAFCKGIQGNNIQLHLSVPIIRALEQEVARKSKDSYLLGLSQ